MSNSDSTRVVTGPRTRLNYVTIVEPAGYYGSTPKYSLCLLIPKDDTETVDKINTAMRAAYELGQGKLKNTDGSIPPYESIRSPLRDGDEERPNSAAFRNCYFLNAKSKYKPKVFNARNEEIFDPSFIKSGDYGRVSLNFFVYAAPGNKGLSAGLNNIKFIREGEPIGRRYDPAEEFGDDLEEYFY